MTASVVVSEAARPPVEQQGSARPVFDLEPRAHRVLVAFGVAVGGVVLAASVLVIGGWVGGVDALKSVLPGFSTMKVNTAIATGALGGSLALTGAGKRYRAMADALSGLALVVGVLTLAQYAFHWDAGIDQLWFRDTVTSPHAAPGRPAIATAVMATLLGAALLCAGRPALAGGKTVAAVIAGMIAWTTLTGYMFGPQALREVWLFSSVAIHTAGLMLLLALGVLATDPVSWPIQTALTHGTGGVICRWLLPPAIVAPPIFGWLLSRHWRSGLLSTPVRLGPLFDDIDVRMDIADPDARTPHHGHRRRAQFGYGAVGGSA